MVVQHNISAMTANRYYGVNNKGLANSLEKLASGYAINKAGDNAAGLAVSEKMRAQIGGLTQASKNAEDGISMVQTFEGALQETDSILQRMRTLAVQSANGSYQNEVDRDAIQLEFDQLNDELNQIADTDYNGVVMLNGGVMADGTVANSYNKVADRPNIEQVTTEPDTAFTYKSIVNGTVDSAGNGSLSINGVSVKLKAGEGSATLSKGGNETTYTTDGALEIEKGKVNGKISAKETYKIDDKTTQIEIHGNSYQVKEDSLVDANGDKVNVIDGLAVSVSKNSKVELSGTYDIVDNVVKTQASFEDKTTGIGGVLDGLGTGRVIVNSTTIGLNEGAQATTGTIDDKTIPEIKYQVDGNFTVTNGLVEGKISVSGHVDAAKYDDKDGETPTGPVKTTLEDVQGYSFGNSDGQIKDGANTTVRILNVNGAIVGSKDGTDWYSLTETQANYILTGHLPTDDETTNITELGATNAATNFDAVVAGTATGVNTTALTKLTGGILKQDGNYGVQNSATADTVAITAIDLKNADVGSDLTVRQSGFTVGTKFYATTLDGSTKWADGKTTDKALSNKSGVAIKLTGDFTGTGANGKIVISKQSDTAKDVGTFKISKGVSTSDAYNHGTRNLTYADSMTLQVGARAKDAVNFNFDYTTNGIGTLKADMNASARGLGTDQLSVKDQKSANFAIDQIDNAINKTNMIRATFGSVQNRLEHKINNIDTNTENLTAAESRIRDTQMDKEMMKFTSSQILSQASQSMLAQANQLPQGVLQLLG